MHWTLVMLIHNPFICKISAPACKAYRSTSGDEFGIRTMRLVGGASFAIVFADKTRGLAFFNHMDIEGSTSVQLQSPDQ
jgi:hypothetical protein